MATRRSLHKKISLNTELDAVSDQAALLFTWMIPHADDFGRITGNIRKLAATVVPLRFGKPGWTVEDIERYLVELENAKDEAGTPLIIRYSVGKMSVIWLTGFESLQDGLHKRTKSVYPDPPEELLYNFPGISGKLREVPKASRKVREIPFRNEEKRNEEKGRKEDTFTLDRSKILGYGGGGDNSGVEGIREEGEKSSAAFSAASSQENLYMLFQGEFGRPLSPMEVDQIKAWAEKYGYEMLREALRRAVLNGKLSMRYIDRILLRWEKDNIRCLREVQEKDPLGSENAARAGHAGENNGIAAQSRAGPANGGNVVDLEKKRREEKIRAALGYIRLKFGENLNPHTDEVRELAMAYGEDVYPEIMEKLLELCPDGGGPP